MACFYVIYRDVFSEWRSIRQLEINQCNITMATHYDITRVNDVARAIYCDVTMHNDVDMNLFYCVVSAPCLIVLFYYG